MEEKQELIRNLQLCFGCLRSSSHISKDCKDRAICRICQRLHPTSLHKPIPREGSANENVQINESTNQEANNFNMVTREKNKSSIPRNPCPLESKTFWKKDNDVYGT
jgi:hypothetical protein